jgi:hypothetical protein
VEYIKLPSQLPRFINTETILGSTRTGGIAYILRGELASFLKLFDATRRPPLSHLKSHTV